MNKLKKICVIGIILIFATSFAGCFGEPISDEEIVKTIVDGTIKINYQGESSPELLAIVGMDEEDVEDYNQQTLLENAEYMLYIYRTNDSSNITDYAEDFVGTFKELFSYMDYEVSDPVEKEEGVYTVTIKFKPFLLAESIDPEFFSVSEDIVAEYGERESISGDDLIAAEEKIADVLKTEMEAFFEAPQYGEEETIEVEVKKDLDGLWVLDQIGVYEFSDKIIDYDLGY